MLTLWLLAESDIPILPRVRITKTQTCSRKIAPVLLSPVFDHTSSLAIYSLGRMRGVLSLLDDSDLRNDNGRLRLPGFNRFDVEIITMEYAIERDHSLQIYEQRKMVLTKGLEDGSALGNFIKNNGEQGEKLKAKIDAEEELSDEELYAIEWNKVLEVYRALKLRLSKYDRMTVLPDGWITVTDEDGKPYTILIFRDQLKGIKKLREKQITEWIRKDRSVTPADVIAKCFNSFCNAPTENEIRAYIHHIRTEQDRPQLHLLKDRKKIDPYYVVRETLPENTSLESYAGTVYDSYPAAADIFGSREDYISAVMYLKEHPEEDLIGSKVEELPLEFIPYDLTPKHDLAELTQEVKDEYFGGEYEGITLVEWTDAYYKSYFGVHYPDGRVYINKILNSENVDREVIKFVIYHEFIHRDVQLSHILYTSPVKYKVIFILL